MNCFVQLVVGRIFVLPSPPHLAFPFSTLSNFKDIFPTQIAINSRLEIQNYCFRQLYKSPLIFASYTCPLRMGHIITAHYSEVPRRNFV